MKILEQRNWSFFDKDKTRIVKKVSQTVLDVPERISTPTLPINSPRDPDSVHCRKGGTHYSMMNINFPVDSESTDNGGQEMVSEGDANRDPLSSALDRLTEHFVKRINRLKIN